MIIWRNYLDSKSKCDVCRTPIRNEEEGCDWCYVHEPLDKFPYWRVKHYDMKTYGKDINIVP